MNNDADSVNPDTHKFYFDVPGVKAANFGAFTHDYVPVYAPIKVACV